jgi:hypothetical protein
MSLHLSAGDDSPYETGGGPSCKKLKQEYPTELLHTMSTTPTGEGCLTGQLWAICPAAQELPLHLMPRCRSLHAVLRGSRKHCRQLCPSLTRLHADKQPCRQGDSAASHTRLRPRLSSDRPNCKFEAQRIPLDHIFLACHPRSMLPTRLSHGNKASGICWRKDPSSWGVSLGRL